MNPQSHTPPNTPPKPANGAASTNNPANGGPKLAPNLTDANTTTTATTTSSPIIKKHKAKLIIGLSAAGAFLILVLAVGLAYYWWLLPVQRIDSAQQTVSSFFRASADNDSASLDKLLRPETRATSHDFMIATAKKVGTDCKITETTTISASYVKLKADCNNGAQSWNFGVITIDGTRYIDQLAFH